MTKKDYIKFADMIAERKAIKDNPPMLETVRQAELNSIQSELINIFESDNPSFDADRFNQYIDNRVKSIMDSVQ